MNDDHAYEAEILAYPEGHPIGFAESWSGTNATEDVNGLRIIAGLSDTMIGQPAVTNADLYPETTIAYTPFAWNNPTNYGDPSTFLREHLTVLGTNPSRWSTTVLLP